MGDGFRGDEEMAEEVKRREGTRREEANEKKGRSPLRRSRDQKLQKKSREPISVDAKIARSLPAEFPDLPHKGWQSVYLSIDSGYIPEVVRASLRPKRGYWSSRFSINIYCQ
jgi:hypothetical protein